MVSNAEWIELKMFLPCDINHKIAVDYVQKSRTINEKETYASLCGAVRNKHISEVTGQSRDRPLTFKQSSSDVSSN